MYLHDLITYSCTKCIEMLSGLFLIQTNSLISFHKQSSVLLHQGTTFKKLLSLVFYRKRAVLHQVSLTFCKCRCTPGTGIWWSRVELCKVTLTFAFMHQVVLSFEDADIPPPHHRAVCWSRALLHQVSLTFTFMHQIGLTFEDADVHSAECN